MARRLLSVAAVTLLALVGVVGEAGIPGPAHALAGGITVPASGTFEPNNADGTFTYTYAATIATAPEAQADEPETPTCTASGATGGSVGLTSFTFNQGTTVVSCTAPEDDAAPDNVPDTGSFTVTVTEPRPVFDTTSCTIKVPFCHEVQTADGTDTATFTSPLTAQEVGEPSEAVSVICRTNDFAATLLTFPVTLNTGGHGYNCTGTDTTDNSSRPSGFSLFLDVQDERTVLSNPGNQTATPDATTHTALVSYPTVTPTETPSGESDGQAAGCIVNNGATSTNFFASSGTFNVGVTTVSCNANDIPNAPGKDGTNPPGQSATQITFTVTVGAQTITFVGPGSGPVGGSAALSATATSGLPVSFSVDATSDPGVCNLDPTGLTVNYTAVGNCVIDANQAGDFINYAPAPQVQQNITVVGTQTITFLGPTFGTVGGSDALSATGGGSGNPVLFSVDATSGAGVCNVDPTGPTVNYTAVGNCVIDANQAGNANYTAAPQVQSIIPVGQAQTITFVGPGSGLVGASATLSATGGGSTSPVVFSVDPFSDPGACNVSGLNGSTVNYTAVGNCVIDANQAGDANYTPAPQVQQSITVGQGAQTITFVGPGSGKVGASATLSATGGGSTSPVVFSVDPTSGAGVCNVSGLNGSTVNYTAVGHCVIDANQAGDANYTAAPQVQRSITVTKACPTAVAGLRIRPGPLAVGGVLAIGPPLIPFRRRRRSNRPAGRAPRWRGLRHPAVLIAVVASAGILLAACHPPPPPPC